MILWFNCFFPNSDASTNVMILSVHVGANPLYGYYAAAPVYRVAVRHIRQRWPTSLSNLTHTAIYMPGYDLCPDGGDHTAEFFAGYYYEHWRRLTAPETYLVLASPECTNQALVLADFARDLDLPLFISVAGSTQLTNRKRYPTTSPQAALSGNDVLQSLEALLNRFSWRTLSLICDPMTQAPGLANFFYARCGDLQKFFIKKGYTWYNKEFNSATERNFSDYLSATKDRSRIYILLTLPQFIRQLMIEASKLDMSSGDFAFIAIQPTQRPGIGPVSWRGNGTHEDDKMAVDAFKSLLVITGVVPVWSQIASLTSEISETARIEYNYTYPHDAQESDVQIGIYESTMMFAQVFDENYPEVINMTKKRFIEKCSNRSFSFAGRNYASDADGGKVLPVVVQRFNRRTELMETAMLFDTVRRKFYDEVPELWYWVGRNSSPPDVPKCGFRNDHCDGPTGAGLLIGILITVFTVLLIVCGIALHFVVERRKELRRLWWLVERSTLQSTADERTAGIKVSVVYSMLGRKYRLLRTQQPLYMLTLETPEPLTVSSFHNNKKLLHVLLNLRYLNHPCLATFKGISPGHRDIALESAILHVLGSFGGDGVPTPQSVEMPRNLSSLVCIIDARFTAKIAESGYARIFEYLNLSKFKRCNEEDQSEMVEMIWKPPEVLAAGTRKAPRPQHDDLLGSCFGPAEFRPTARRLRSLLQRVKKRSNDVIGHILMRIERHATDLEFVVAERTQALSVEMAKADSLLQEMLPREIVLLLRNRQPVPSEQFESVTIMFSDLPVFANIANMCEPLAIIEFLNETYSLIDEVLPEFDVYKVETINDSYVVVSGLPHSNGAQHVFEICRLAVTLLKTAKRIEDPTDSNRKVLLRIGIHTGTCVAGVIGRRMPRYCLFGDSMNTASRMESHGEAGRIHISVATKERVVKSPNFVIESRGFREIKGKGQMETFWMSEARHFSTS
ncbi:Guanylate cyclase 32E [Hypsibius exemplaris]|uniref:Guanylate cyclase 32E n=1 Tax=Hypsibius exemplaris TaxID=2072580 RepID=A0A1W0WV07_HYPEX|nr:Guanylate cyclase 32E [Hypsibius exemplaris]